ncbi:MAG: hypothetical protein KDD66_06715 [Bdellovibrionales bacterium]|nr:hypothetical protein [Bdellovibrionales bacterium]
MSEISQSKSGLIEGESTIAERLSIGGLLNRAEQLGPALTMRELHDADGFGGAVSCKPGEITVLEARGVAALREALAHRDTRSKITLRYGNRELHPSEIHVVAASRYMWKEATAADVLRTAGAVERVVEPLLERVGLSTAAQNAPADLDDDHLRRLTICASFFSPAKVVVFDKPFNPLDDKWINAIASQMLEAVQTTMKVFVVTEISRVPDVWINNPGVVRAQFEAIRADENELSRGEESKRMLTSMRSMMDSNRTVEESGDFIITRPQTIHTKRTRAIAGEALKTEMIINPEVSELAIEDTAPRPSENSNTPRRPPTGKQDLTRVSLIQRLFRDSPVLRYYNRAKFRIRGLLPKKSLESEGMLLGSAKLNKVMKSYANQMRVRNGVFLPMLVVVVAICLIQLMFTFLAAMFG